MIAAYAFALDSAVWEHAIDAEAHDIDLLVEDSTARDGDALDLESKEPTSWVSVEAQVPGSVAGKASPT